ncbi:MAG: DUF5685 family protein [Anaerovoracaceae bacterium]|jgi:polyhydroxyalkanoate synthesis regulator phasin
MLGYITADKPELKLKDYEVYRAYYCGVCKSIGRRWGQLPRAVLSYDAAFLALLLAGAADEDRSLTHERCPVHPLQRRSIAHGGAVDYSADVMLLLAWNKLDDDVRDEGSLRARTARQLSRRLYRRLRRAHPALTEQIEARLRELAAVEAAGSEDLDAAGDVFGRLMAALFTGFDAARESERALAQIGYQLGRWIYLMDAWDDLGDNMQSGAYNPLLRRYHWRAPESQEDFRLRVHDETEKYLLFYLAELGKAVDLLAIRRNRDIIENVVYLGLLRRTEQALGKENEHL